jgi:trigger factor
MRLVYGASDGCAKNGPGSGRRLGCGRDGGGRGGIGRRTGFRFQRCKSWGFKSPRPHHGAAEGRVRLGYYGLRFMQVTEISADGLKREFTVTVPAGDLEQEITRRLDELGRQVRLPGFRPGKVPMQILRKRFGPSVRGEVLQSTLQASSAEAISERNLRPALPPRVDIVSAGEGADLEYKMAVELLPEIPEPSFDDLAVERLVVEVPERDVDRAIERIADQQRKSEIVERPAEVGDIVVVDVEGKIGEKEIAGAGGKDRQIVLGAGSSIPGFEDQLVGAAAGEHRTVRVTFPEDYAAADLAGKDGLFTVDVKEVRERSPIALDDELGRAVGLESLAELRQELRQQMQRDYDAASRLRLKRAVLDKLAEGCDFAVPPGMVDIEFDNIWRQYQAQKVSTQHDSTIDAPPPAAEESAADTSPTAAEPDDSGESEEESKAEFRKIAERRVRLGLLLAEVGQRNNITVTPEEVNQAITREARRHPGYERQVLDFYRQNPGAIDTLRAPIFEDKVIDFIVELAKIGERKITPEELLAMPEPAGEDAVPS